MNTGQSLNHLMTLGSPEGDALAGVPLEGEPGSCLEEGMIKADIRTGGIYIATVSGTRCRVQVTGENPAGGWDGLNLATKRRIRIRSARRLEQVGDEGRRRWAAARMKHMEGQS